ncbi:MAG: DUF6514 family protein [Oscillospiraceae bacterium]
MVINSLVKDDVCYEIMQETTIIECEEIAQYGIKMSTEQGDVVVKEISQDYSVVENLVILLQQNDVDPITLEEIVEEFITEQYTY